MHPHVRADSDCGHSFTIPPRKPAVTEATAAASRRRSTDGSSRTLHLSGAAIEIEIHLNGSSLSGEDVYAWIVRAAEAVSTYYGRFPLQHARILVTIADDKGESIHGTTWGDVRGVQGLSRMQLGRGVTKDDLAMDWTMTHELVHMALASLPDEAHWLEEGLATYVEPIARSQAGQLDVDQVWTGMIDGLPHGEPNRNDHGLDRTHTWGRTYWGGAMFCLIADVKIRQETHNRKGLQDALRAIVAANLTIDKDSTVHLVLATGDRATGTTVLEDLYKSWKDHPVTVDLMELWHQLGVNADKQPVTFNEDAPLSQIRRELTPECLLHVQTNRESATKIHEWFPSTHPGSRSAGENRQRPHMLFLPVHSTSC